jgi:hypothetical protein
VSLNDIGGSRKGEMYKRTQECGQGTNLGALRTLGVRLTAEQLDMGISLEGENPNSGLTRGCFTMTVRLLMVH